MQCYDHTSCGLSTNGPVRVLGLSAGVALVVPTWLECDQVDRISSTGGLAVMTSIGTSVATAVAVPARAGAKTTHPQGLLRLHTAGAENQPSDAQEKQHPGS